MKIPKLVKVGGRDYQVLYPHKFQDSHCVLYGLHDPGTQIIRLSEKDEQGSKRHPQSIEHTLLHEIIHAIDAVYFGGKISSWEKGEDAIDQLAEGLIQVIGDNKLNFGEREK
jgi:hypothetical protein